MFCRDKYRCGEPAFIALAVVLLRYQAYRKQELDLWMVIAGETLD